MKKYILYPGGHTQHPQHVPDYLSYHCRPMLRSSWKSIYTFYRNVGNKYTTGPRWETIKQYS